MKPKQQSKFEELVYSRLRQVPKGRVTTYQALATACGSDHAYRAVGNALGKNTNAPKVPCHRVVCSDGSLGGYRLGSNKKIEILRTEGVEVEQGKVIDFQKIIYNF